MRILATLLAVGALGIGSAWAQQGGPREPGPGQPGGGMMQGGPGGMMGQGGQGGMMGQGGVMGPRRLTNLKELPSERVVKEVRYCDSKYHITTVAGDILEFPEFNLRFKTDAGDLGPRHGTPVLHQAGMMGDRAFLIFADPAEISGLIEKKCN